MAFASTITSKENSGSLAMRIGTFTNGGADTGGDVDTGLSVVDSFVIIETGAAVVANRSVVNETFPLASNAVTIVTDADVDGIWMAWGKE
jgi:predicted membrane GTPase involved in stress response